MKKLWATNKSKVREQGVGGSVGRVEGVWEKDLRQGSRKLQRLKQKQGDSTTVQVKNIVPTHWMAPTILLCISLMSKVQSYTYVIQESHPSTAGKAHKRLEIDG